MFEVVITVYKPSGKYYTDHTVRSETDMNIWEDEFTLFIWNNLPARYEGGYVVVTDTDVSINAGGFHTWLYKYDELQNNILGIKKESNDGVARH